MPNNSVGKYYRMNYDDEIIIDFWPEYDVEPGNIDKWGKEALDILKIVKQTGIHAGVIFEGDAFAGTQPISEAEREIRSY